MPLPSRLNTRLRSFLGCIAAALTCHLAHGGTASAPSWHDDLTLKAFGTLGLARSSLATPEYVRDLSQPRGLDTDWSGNIDSVLGLQANWTLGAQSEAVVQLISRYRYDGSHRPEVSWAFLRRDFSPDWQVRIGRLGTEFYMLADSRLVGYSNIAVRPPPDFYGPLIFSYFDGADTTVSRPLAGGLLRAKLFAGRSPETSPFVDDETWNLDGTRLLGGYLDYFSGAWQWRIGRTVVDFANEHPFNHVANQALAAAGYGMLAPIDLLGMIPELRVRHTTTTFDSLGAVYDQGPLHVQGMVGRIRYETEAYEDSRSAFVLAAYRIGRLTPYLGYSKVKSSASTIATEIPFISDFARRVTAASHTDQHTVTLGSRWDIHPNWALKLQWDNVRGQPDSMFSFRGANTRWSGEMRIFSATLDFVF